MKKHRARGWAAAAPRAWRRPGDSRRQLGARPLPTPRASRRLGSPCHRRRPRRAPWRLSWTAPAPSNCPAPRRGLLSPIAAATAGAAAQPRCRPPAARCAAEGVLARRLRGQGGPAARWMSTRTASGARMGLGSFRAFEQGRDAVAAAAAQRGGVCGCIRRLMQMERTTVPDSGSTTHLVLTRASSRQRSPPPPRLPCCWAPCPCGRRAERLRAACKAMCNDENLPDAAACVSLHAPSLSRRKQAPHRLSQPGVPWAPAGRGRGAGQAAAAGRLQACFG